MHTKKIQSMSTIKLRISRHGQFGNWVRSTVVAVNWLSTLVLVLTINAVAYAQSLTDLGQLTERGQWERTLKGPLSPRRNSSVAMVGSEIFVFGGDVSISACALPGSTASCSPSTIPLLKDGAAYDVNTDSWRHISDAPFGFSEGLTATLGSDVYLLAWLGAMVDEPFQLLRYQANEDRWQEIELPDSLAAPWISAFGSNLLLYSYSDELGSGRDWLFDTSAAAWEPMPEDPLGMGFSRQYVAHDRDLYLFDKKIVPSPGGADGPAYWRVARYRNEQWEVLPTADSIGFVAPILVSDNRLISPELGCADGGSTNGYGRCIAYGGVFNTLSDSWDELPNAPGRGIKHINSSGGLSAEHLVLIYRAGGPAFDATNDQWFIFPTLDSDPAGYWRYHAVGKNGFVFGGIHLNEDTGSIELLNDGWIWKP